MGDLASDGTDEETQKLAMEFGPMHYMFRLMNERQPHPHSRVDSPVREGEPLHFFEALSRCCRWCLSLPMTHPLSTDFLLDKAMVSVAIDCCR